MRYNHCESVCGHSQNVLVSVLNVTVEIRNEPSPVRMPRSKAYKSLRTVLPGRSYKPLLPASLVENQGLKYYERLTVRKIRLKLHIH
jgi:hypothetical protein